MSLLKEEIEIPKKDGVDLAIEAGKLLEPTYEEPKEKPIKPLPNLFPPGRKPLVNYDWIDMVSATGYVLFDAINAIDSTGNNYILIDSTHSENLVGTGGSTTLTVRTQMTEITGNSGQSADIDFDATAFQLPRTIEGDAFVRVSIASESAQINTLTITTILRKWDGSSETDIVSVTAADIFVTVNNDYFTTLKLVVPRTHFKKGEQIRLTIRITTDDNDKYELGHNPADTAVATSNLATGNSRTNIAIPFKLDFM